MDLMMDDKLVALFLDLNLNAARRIKLGNSYGPEMRPFNALGQGDPLVLIVAIAYVSTQFFYLDKVAPLVDTGAIVDDRSLRGPLPAVQKAVEEVMDFDRPAADGSRTMG